MSRKVCYLSGADLMRLNDACIRIDEAFGMGTFLVGSVAETPDFRDVDVRTILADEDFDALFGGREFFWSLFCLSVTEYLRAATGLPIDYQVQRQSIANEKYPSSKHKRNGLGHCGRLYAGGGDATKPSIPKEIPKWIDAPKNEKRNPAPAAHPGGEP